MIQFAISVFGIVFVMRTSRGYFARGLVRHSFLLVCAIGSVTFILGIPMWFGASPWWTELFRLGLGFLPLIFGELDERRALGSHRARIPTFLDRWLLNLRLGDSVSLARDKALREDDPTFRALLAPVFDLRAANSTETHPLLTPALRRELAHITREPHAAHARLDNLRRTVRRTADFRRKSGQAVRQTSIQAVVMLILAIALSAYVIARYGVHRAGDLVAFAMILSGVGIVSMHVLARKTRWRL